MRGERMALLDVDERAAESAEAGHPRVFLLDREVLLLAWDVAKAVDAVVPLSVAGGLSIAPTASLRLTLAEGGTRLLWALRRPAGMPLNICLSASAPGERVDIAIGAQEAVAPADAASLLGGLDAAGRLALLSALLSLWPSLFRLRRSRAYLRLLRSLLQAMAPNPPAAVILARAADDFVLVETMLAAGFGRIDAAYAVSDRGLCKLEGVPHCAPLRRDGRQSVHWLAGDAALSGPGALIVLTGPDGMSVRALTQAGTQPPTMVRWLREKAQGAPGLREHLLRELSERSEAGQAMALEAQLRAPLQPRRVAGGGATPSAEIATALATASGTLVTGWYRDPSDLVAGIEAVTGNGPQDLTPGLHRFPVDIEGPGEDIRLRATGFAVRAPAFQGAVPLLQPRFRLRLKSGAFHDLVPGPQPVDPAERRAAALRAVPPQHVNEAVLAGTIAPVIERLHAEARGRIGEPSVVMIGRPLARPRVSVVVPLYRVLDFLRFQIAAFAADAWFRDHAELIYVLDSPDQARDVEHLLTGLHLVYALPMRLVVMARNAGFARACNTGAAEARGPVLAMVNSDVVPTAPGWLPALAKRLDGRRGIGAVGPKLLFEDDSLQHAGMFFSQDHRGRWLNQHFHKGMPRDYAPACKERIVPAVTGACLVLPRPLFDDVGGFTEDYVIGDYEDSDLCLKITARGRRILYAPSVELYHLERKSMKESADYMRGIAWQYNCALHTARWGDLITDIMESRGSRRRRRERSLCA